MTDKLPLVSVIIPTYNRSDLIKKPIDSVLNQSYSNIELIVVDDGSTDDTLEVIKSYNSNEVRYIQHENNKGANAARNTGLANCNGKYISYLDSDVVMKPNKIEEQVAAINQSDENIGVIYGPAYSKRGEFVKCTPKEGYTGNIYSDLLSFDVKVITSTTLIKRKCFENCGKWDSNLPSFNEYDLCLRIAKKYNFKYVPEPLVVSLSHNKPNITSNINKRENGMNAIVNKWGDEMEKVHGSHAVSDFKRRSELVTYKESSIWNAKNGNKLKSIKLAHKYTNTLGYIDLRYMASFSSAFINRHFHDSVKNYWYKKTGKRISESVSDVT